MTDRIDQYLVRYVDPVDVQLEEKYKQIGIRSHGKGIFHKDPVTGKALGNKRVYWVHPKAFTVNIVFAWEQAVALTSENEKGYIASHRFLMFLPKEDKVSLEFILRFFLQKRGKHLLELASPGGAGRNKTLGKDRFAELKITLPQKEEQEKIANFLGEVDARLGQLRRKHELLQTYKRGVMQKLFCMKTGSKKHKKQPEIRFLGFSGDWQPRSIDSFVNAENIAANENIPLYSLTIEHGVTEKTERYERSFLVKKTGEAYKLINPNSFAYNPMNLRFGALARHKQGFPVKVSKYYDIFSVNSTVDVLFVEALLTNEDSIRYYDSLAEGSLIEKKRLHFSEFKKICLLMPSFEEQKKISAFLNTLDQKIIAVAQQIESIKLFKQGLLQKMFV